MPDYYNRFLESMQLHDFKIGSRDAYLLSVRLFLDHTGKAPELLTLADVRNYLLFLKNERGLSSSTINAKNSAIKYFFQYVLDIPWNEKYVPRMKLTCVQPHILSRQQVFDFINSMDNMKYRVITAIMYSAGLRVGEVVKLRYEDISRTRRTIHVPVSKNRSDRYSILSENTLELLTHFWFSSGRPMGYLFLSRATGQCLTVASVQSYLNVHAHKLGLEQRIYPHLFRHCFATHLLESGTDVAVIQQMLGHKDPGSTSRYLHLTSKCLLGIKSPFDEEAGLR